jgi:carboxymethylenebutenolidase
MRKIERMVAAAVLGMAVTGGAWAGEKVEIPGPGGKAIAGYLALPEGQETAPAVVVIHEWWGLTDWVKGNADRLAKLGYVALAVDLYDGKATDDAGEAHELMRALDQSEGVAKLKAGVAYLEGLDRVEKGKKVGAIGWCMGGGYSRQLAQAMPEVGPIVICYGSVATEPEQIKQLAGKPVLGIFGATDRGIPVAKVEEFAGALKKAGSEVDLHIYPDAGHGFMRPGGPQYAEGPAADAWKQIEGFLAGALKAGK